MDAVKDAKVKKTFLFARPSQQLWIDDRCVLVRCRGFDAMEYVRLIRDSHPIG
jgi:hypothetical protein